MRYALIADIHGNLPALEATLVDIDARDPDHVYHLGDLVGYGSAPNEVVRLIREREIGGVGGNFDSAIALDDEPKSDDETAARNFRWTAREITGSTRDFLAALPFRVDLRPEGGHAPGPRVVLVHATPILNTTAWWSHLPDEFHLEMASYAGANAGDVICFGHIHRPWHRQIGGIEFVSAGSVGRPKDGDPRSCYVILDVTKDGIGVEFVRVEYEVERAARGVIQSGLPVGFGEFLRTGGAPAPAGPGS